MLNIRKATPAEYDRVKTFYYDMIDGMQNAEFKPAWEKGVYPSDEFLKQSFDNYTLYIGITQDEIVSAMVMNNECNESYSKAKWEHEYNPNEFAVIHALAILPAYQGHGYAKQMCQYAIEKVKSDGLKAIRLDVLGTNIPAQKLYTSIGFIYADTINMYYEDTGWTDFLLYEYIIQ